MREIAKRGSVSQPIVKKALVVLKRRGAVMKSKSKWKVNPDF